MPKLGDGAELSYYARLVATGVQQLKVDAPGVELLTGAGRVQPRLFCLPIVALSFHPPLEL